MIRFGAPVAIGRAFLPGTSYSREISTTQVDVAEDGDLRTERSRARHMMRDFTGDGLPDLVYKFGGQWVLHRGRVTASGPQFGGAAMTWSEPAELFEQTTKRRTDDDPAARAAMITTETWSQFVDWDGDGRLDVIDVNGGSDGSHWQVWLNRRATNGDIAWTAVQVDIAPIRAHLLQRGFVGVLQDLGNEQRIAIDRARSWPRYDVTRCTTQHCTTAGCEAVTPCPSSSNTDAPQFPPNHDYTWRIDTMSDWTLTDLNGDGFLDVVAGTIPVQHHEDGLWGEDYTTVCETVPDDLNHPNDAYARICRLSHQQWIDAIRWEHANGDPGQAALPVALGQRVEFLNRHGAFQGLNESPFSPVGRAAGDAAHGVTRWTSGTSNLGPYASPGNGSPIPPATSPPHWQASGYADRRGDGMATVRSFGSYDEINAMPAFLDDREPRCATEDRYTSRQVKGEIDLDGDGRPDDISGRTVRFNLGTGLGRPRTIASPMAMPFELSLSDAECGGAAHNISGLTDLDGDGKPDLLRVIDGQLWMSRFEVAAGADAVDAQRLITIDNGYGAVTYIKYKNAKRDDLAGHDVPFPEIVVGETGTRVLDGSGPNLAPTYHAYGGAQMIYDPLAASWVFPGYRRHVAMRGKPERAGDSSIAGLVTITDRDPAAPAGSTYADQVTAGRVSQVSRFETTTVPQPELFLGWNGTPIHAQATQTHGAVVLASGQGGGGPPIVAPEALECGDLDPVSGELVGTAMCRIAGLAQPRSSESWEGSAAPPSLANLMSGSVVTSGDRYGRPTGLSGKGDLRRTDDDVCTAISYATPASDEKFPVESPFPSVVSSIVLTDCGLGRIKDGEQGTPAILSAAHFRYDGLPLGQVARGLLTARDVDRYGPSGYLDGHEVEAFTYNELGEVETSTSTRSLSSGATQATWFTYDGFGATVTQLGTQASDTTASLVATAATSTWPSGGSAETDHAGLTTLVTYDAHGRMVREIARTSAQKTTRRRFQYQDTAPRRMTLETFPGTTLAGAEDAATDRIRAHTTLDALGRARFTQVELGADYDHQTLVSGFTRHDELGRPVYVAAPFEAPAGFSPTATTVLPYGTTTTYDPRGRVTRVTTAQGQNPTASTTSVSGDVFVRNIAYAYDSGMVRTTSRGSDENDPGSPRYGAHDDAWSTAIGRQVRRVRAAASGTTLDRVDQEWDRLARVTQTRRYLVPAMGAGAVVWQSTFDSLGNRLSLTEPGVATKIFDYDELGNEIASSWMDGTTRRLIATQYDGLGRLTHRLLATTPAGGPTTIESQDRLTWDTHVGGADQPDSPLLGRLSAVETVGVGKVFYGYDEHGRTSSTTYRYAEHGERVREAATFTPGGRLVGLDLETPRTTDQIRYQHDSAGRVRQVVVGGETLFDATRVTAKGQYLRVSYGNGVDEDFQYADGGPEQLLSWSALTGSGTYRSVNVDHDGAGRVTMETHETPSSTTNRAYVFDDLGRVSSSVQLGGVGAGTESYTHDPLGNVLTRTATTGATNRVYSFDPADPDRLCRADAPGGGSGPCQLLYDGAGNVTADRTGSGFWNFRFNQYDAASRLVLARRFSTLVSFQYGPAGRARTRVINAPDARTVWHFGGLIEEVHRSGWPLQIQSRRRVPGPLGIVASLRTDSAGRSDTVYSHGDARGSRFFTDADGTVIQDATYSLFGKLTSNTGDPASLAYTDDLWNGGDHVPEVGLTLLGARAYDPELGRFLQRDPMMLTQRSVTANPYAFAFNDPVNLTDPSGMQPAEENPLGIPDEGFPCFACEGGTFGGASGGDRDAGHGDQISLPGASGVSVFGGGFQLGDFRVRPMPTATGTMCPGCVGRFLWNLPMGPAFHISYAKGFVGVVTDTATQAGEQLWECKGFALYCGAQATLNLGRAAAAAPGLLANAGAAAVDDPLGALGKICPDGSCGEAAGAVGATVAMTVPPCARVVVARRWRPERQRV